MKNNFFHNKRVLITGIDGFVGSALSEKISLYGGKVYGISKRIKEKNTIKADILDYPVLDAFIRNSKIDICFHLAGESLVEAGQTDPRQTYKINIEGTLNILESARKNKLKKIIVASTSHVYGHNRVPYYEGYTPKPTRPYETSKACTDLIAQSYARSFNLPVLIPRFVNIYGPGDLHFNRLIPKTIMSVLTSKHILMWGGNVIRDYLYIDDAVDAYIHLAEVDLKTVGNNRIFNIGAGERISVKEVIEKIIKLSEKVVSLEKIKEERNEEIEIQYVSFNKATKLLGWKPKTTLDQGLKNSLLWYSKYLGK